MAVKSGVPRLVAVMSGSFGQEVFEKRTNGRSLAGWNSTIVRASVKAMGKKIGTVNQPEPAAPPGKGERSRSAILTAAARLATTHGLHGLSIGELAGHLNMSKSGLYAHFESKEELELATIDTAAA